jgi:predicted DNA-binding protein
VEDDMQTQNITLSLPKEVMQKIKILAVKRGTSVSSLLTQILNQLVDEETQYYRAQQRQLKWMHQGFNLGVGDQITTSREDLHERRD